MSLPDDDAFLTTRHIDIPPDLTDEIGVSRKTVSAGGARRRNIIKIAKSKPGTVPIGDPDFQELLQNIYDAVIITELSGQVINVNVRAVHFFLRDAEEICGCNVVTLISGADSSLLSTIWQTLQSDRFVLIQACCMRKDGTIFPAEISVNRLVLSGKDFLSFFVRDVTLRKEAEDKLRTGYNAIQNAGSGIAILSANADLEYCNAALGRLLLYDQPEDLLGRNLRQLLPSPDVVEEIARVVAAGESWSHEMELIRRDGIKVPVQLSAAPNLNFDGDFAGIVLSVLDISELKTVQTQLEDYARELRAKNTQMQDDLKMAREVQMAFLPRDYPRFPSDASPDEAALRFSHLYLPSGDVGGDFFDIIPISNTLAGVLIADVVGHGVRSALVVATIRGLIEQLTPIASDPAPFLTQLNQAYSGIFRETGEVNFATALYLVFNVHTGQVAYSSAGHLPAFRLRRKGGVVETMKPMNGAQGPALGLYDNSPYRDDKCIIDPDDVILLYTDGLSETCGPGDEYYDVTRMPAFLKKNLRIPPADLLKGVVADARQFSGNEHFEDDVCLLAVELHRLVG